MGRTRNSRPPTTVARIGFLDGVCSDAVDRYLCDTLITMDGPTAGASDHAAAQVIARGAVDVGDDGRIIWCGPAAQAPPGGPSTKALSRSPRAAARGQANTTADAGVNVHRIDGILMPGFVNAHCHTPMVLLRGAGEGLPVDRWLHEVMWPREAKLTADDVRAGMRLGAAELLCNGITTSVEMYFNGQAVAEGAQQAGLRCLVTAPVIEDAALSSAGPWQEQLDDMVATRERWAADDLIDVGLGPHAAYSVSKDCLSKIAELACTEDMTVHIHVAEQQWEDAAVRERSGGLSAPKYLEQLGLLQADVIAAHCVWLTPEDIKTLARHDVAVAHCPCSNAKHASGVAAVQEQRAAGLRVAIATDGPASHHRLDLFEEMRTAIRTARIRAGDAQVMSAAEALRMTTAGAAEAIGRGGELGRIAPGCWADMVALSPDSSAMHPVIEHDDDPVSRIVWSGSASAVSAVWVAGRQVVGPSGLVTLDVAETLAEATARARRLAGSER